MDGRPNRVNKATFSNLPGAVWTQPERKKIMEKAVDLEVTLACLGFFAFY